MPMKMNCPSCQVTLTLPEKLFGKKVKCPKCETGFVVPNAQQPAPAPTPKPAEGTFDFGESVPSQSYTPKSRRSSSADQKPKWILPTIVGGAVVVIGTVVAILASSGGDDKPGGDTSPKVVNRDDTPPIKKTDQPPIKKTDAPPIKKDDEKPPVKPPVKPPTDGLAQDVIDRITASSALVEMRDDKGNSSLGLGVFLDEELLLTSAQRVAGGGQKTIVKPLAPGRSKLEGRHRIFSKFRGTSLILIPKSDDNTPVGFYSNNPEVDQEIYILSYDNKRHALAPQKVKVIKKHMGFVGWDSCYEIDFEPPKDYVYGSLAVSKSGDILGMVLPSARLKNAIVGTTLEADYYLKKAKSEVDAHREGASSVAKILPRLENGLFRSMVQATRQKKGGPKLQTRGWVVSRDHFLIANWKETKGETGPYEEIFYVAGSKVREKVELVHTSKKLGFLVYRHQRKVGYPWIPLAKENPTKGETVFALTPEYRERKNLVDQIEIKAVPLTTDATRAETFAKGGFPGSPVVNMKGMVIGMRPLPKSGDEEFHLILSRAILEELVTVGVYPKTALK